MPGYGSVGCVILLWNAIPVPRTGWTQPSPFAVVAQARCRIAGSPILDKTSLMRTHPWPIKPFWRSPGHAAKRCAATASAVLAVACGSFNACAQAPPAPAGPGASSEAPNAYLIGPEDVLDISVWKEDGLKKELLVRPDGGISFPLIGEIQAAGKTAAQLQSEIVARLTKYIPDPVVHVSIQKIASNKIYVLGKVNKPGEYLTGRYIDVLQALSMAGGLTPFASENAIKVMRKENGKDTVLPFQFGKVRSGVELQQNIQLKSGDVILVP